MKLKEGVIINKNGNETVLVAAGEAGKLFGGMIRMNSTAGFIAECMKEETTVESIVEALCAKYDVDTEKARESVISVVESLDKVKLLDK